MEKAYEKEYEMLVEKDKADGKDFNWMAFEEMKKAQYFFKFLRDNEKEYKKTLVQKSETPKVVVTPIESKEETEQSYPTEASRRAKVILEQLDR